MSAISKYIIFFVFPKLHICIKYWLCSPDRGVCWLAGLFGVGWFQCVFIIRVCKLDVDLATAVNNGWAEMRDALYAFHHIDLLHLWFHLQLP